MEGPTRYQPDGLESIYYSIRMYIINDIDPKPKSPPRNKKITHKELGGVKLFLLQNEVPHTSAVGWQWEPKDRPVAEHRRGMKRCPGLMPPPRSHRQHWVGILSTGVHAHQNRNIDKCMYWFLRSLRVFRNTHLTGPSLGSQLTWNNAHFCEVHPFRKPSY